MKKLIEQIQTLLGPPGTGVHTVHTASDKKYKLWQNLYQTNSTDLNEIKNLWIDSLSNLEKNNLPLVLGICSDNGGGILRGANWGPLFLRETFQHSPYFPDYLDLGDTKVIPHLLHDKYLNQKTIDTCREALFQNNAHKNELPVSPLSLAEYFCDQLYTELPQSKIFTLGGDHSISYPAVSSYLKSKKNKAIGMIHFDAHTDLLESRLGIDLCFGTWAAAILKDYQNIKAFHQIGIRSTGKDRNHWESSFQVQQYWTDEVKNKGAHEISRLIIKNLKAHKIDEVYVSVDIDALDANYAGATGTPEASGMSPDEVAFIIESIGQEFPLTGADLVEVAPLTKGYTGINPEPDSTLLSATIIATKIIEAMSL